MLLRCCTAGGALGCSVRTDSRRLPPAGGACSTVVPASRSYSLFIPSKDIAIPLLLKKRMAARSSSIRMEHRDGGGSPDGYLVVCFLSGL